MRVYQFPIVIVDPQDLHTTCVHDQLLSLGGLPPPTKVRNWSTTGHNSQPCFEKSEEHREEQPHVQKTTKSWLCKMVDERSKTVVEGPEKYLRCPQNSLFQTNVVEFVALLGFGVTFENTTVAISTPRTLRRHKKKASLYTRKNTCSVTAFNSTDIRSVQDNVATPACNSYDGHSLYQH